MSGTRASRPLRTAAERLLGGWLLGLGLFVLTLVPLPRQTLQGQATPVTCLVCGEYGGIDVVLNVLLFVPLGLALALRGVRVRRVLLLGLLGSLAIELLQLFVITGRDASVSDVLTNTTGATLGALLGWWWRALLFPRPAVARRLAAATLGLWLATQLLVGWMLQPSRPPAPWWAQWAPHYRPYTPFPGTVADVRVGRLALVRDDTLANEPAVRAALDRGDALEVRAVTTGPRLGLSPLFRMVGGWAQPRAEVLFVAQHPREILYRARTRAEDLRLRTPTETAGDVLPRDGGGRLRVVARESARGVQLTVDVGAARTDREVRWSPSMLWAFFVPFGFALDQARLGAMDALWLAGCLLLPAYWAFRGARDKGRREVITAAVVLSAALTAGLAIAALAFGLAPAGGVEWLGGLAGIALGAAAALVSRREERDGRRPRATLERDATFLDRTRAPIARAAGR